MQYDYKEWAEVGLRLRTGDPLKQQDPQVTLGTDSREFGLLPISFEKAYFQGKRGGFKGWLGKNTFPFRNSNELYSMSVFYSLLALYGATWLLSRIKGI